MTSLNKDQIKELLPHREPMLLIDELRNIKKLFSATAILNVKKDSFFVNGHPHSSFDSGVTGPLAFAVQMYNEGQQVTLLPDAQEPYIGPKGTST